MAFATTPWADDVAAGLRVKTKRPITQSPRDVFFYKASRDSKKDHRERETWEACTVVGASVVVAVATEHGPVGKCSAWKAFGEGVGSVTLYLHDQPASLLRLLWCQLKKCEDVSIHGGHGRDGEAGSMQTFAAHDLSAAVANNLLVSPR